MNISPKIKALALALGATFVSPAFAGAYDDYVILSANDDASSAGTGNNESFDNNDKGRWKKNGIAEPTGPHAGEKYYMNGKCLTVSNLTASAISATPLIHMVFQGDELVINGKFWLVAKRKSSDLADMSAVVEVPKMIGLPGGYFYAANIAAAAIEGDLEIASTVTDSNPFRFWVNGGSNFNMIMGFDLRGAAQSCFALDVGDFANETFKYCGDASQFLGTIRVPGNSTKFFLDGCDTYDIPGTVELAEGAILRLGDDVAATIGTIASDGGIIDLGRSGSSAKLIITNGVETNGRPIQLKITHDFVATAEKIPLISFASSAQEELRPSDFVFPDGFKVTKGGTTLSNLATEMTVETDGSGVQTLYLNHRDVVIQDITDGETASNSCFLPENASHWDNDLPPDPEKDYYSSKGCAFPGSSHYFGGASLTIYGSAKSAARSTGTYGFRNLRLVASENETTKYILQVWSGNPTITGRVEVVNGGAGKWYKIDGWNNPVLTFESEIRGSGNLLLSCKRDAATDPRMNYVLSGDNSAFAGKIRLWHQEYSDPAKYADLDTYFTTLKVADGCNLGGAMAGFTPDSLSLEQGARLLLTASGTFNEPTRGWRVVGLGRIEVPDGMTATVTNKQVTYCGTFRKDGAGSLVLGGTAKFTDDQLDDPVAGTNVLRIAGGTLTPASVGACDGLAVSFAAGSSLVLDADAGEELRTKGLVNLKWDSPISVDGGAALPVSFRLPADFDNKVSCRLAICTVNKTAAQSMDADDFAVARVHGMSAKVVKVVNDDQTVTFACDLKPKGFAIIFR